MATAAASAYQFTGGAIATSASQAVGPVSTAPYSTTMTMPAAATSLYGMITVFSVLYGASMNGTWMSDTNKWVLTGTYNAGGFSNWNVADVPVNATVTNSAMPAADTTNASTAGSVAQTFNMATMPSTSYSCNNQGFATNASMRCAYTFTLSYYYPAGLMCAA